MTKPKNIWRVKKNMFGSPLIYVRVLGLELGDLHLFATMMNFELTFRKKANEPKIGTSMMWDRRPFGGWPQSQFQLEQLVHEIIDGFSSGKLPVWVPKLENVEFGVLI